MQARKHRLPLWLLSVLLPTIIHATTLPSMSLEDVDGDGLTGVEEDKNQNGSIDTNETNPLDADTDGGGESDGAEAKAGRNPLAKDDDYTADTDGDGLINFVENNLGTDSRSNDTDGDGLADKDDPFPLVKEVQQTPKTNEDRVKEESTLKRIAKPPFKSTEDMDGDGLTDRQEQIQGTDPKNADTDGDNVGDAKDPFPLHGEYATDTDRDGLPNEWEALFNLNPADQTDAAKDADEDGVTNAIEFKMATNPQAKDSDGDGITDKEDAERSCFRPIAMHGVFADMEQHWALRYVAMLHTTTIEAYERPIVEGYRDNENGENRLIFQPERSISRFEFAKLTLLASCIIPTDASFDITTVFTDTSLTPKPNETTAESFRRHVLSTSVLRHILLGYQDGSLRPDDVLNRAEAVTIILRAIMGEQRIAESASSSATFSFADVPTETWFAPAIAEAKKMGIINGYSDGTFQPARHVSRAEAAKLIWLLIERFPPSAPKPVPHTL